MLEASTRTGPEDCPDAVSADATVLAAVAAFGVTVITNEAGVFASVPATGVTTGVTVTEKAESDFESTAAIRGVVLSSAVLVLVLPAQYELIQFVCDNISACTINDVIATLPKSSGNPTLGLTTHQILP
jgi:hypothetical protein